MEIWKLLEDGIYEISSLGRVRNISTGNYLKVFNRGAYLGFDRFVKKKRISATVHIEVAKAFIPNPLGKPYVNHIDGDKHNNVVSNLEWVTAAENTAHAFREGLMNKKITPETLIEIKELMKLGVRDYEICEEFGLTTNVVSRIRRGLAWVAVDDTSLEVLEKIPLNRKLSAEDIPKIRKMFLEGFTDAEIGKQFSVARGTINQIHQGKTWKNY